MRKAMLYLGMIVGTAAVLTGCAAVGIGKTGNPGTATNNGSGQGSGTGSGTGKKTEIPKKERPDDWKAETDLGRVQGEAFVVPCADAEPVKITFSVETKKEEWDSYLGGADVEYALAQIPDTTPSQVYAFFEDYNTWAQETMETELSEGRERWELYHASSPDSFIALTPRIGMKLLRADTSIVSFVKSIYRYNREYEPNDYFYYGCSFDSNTGRRLSLKDFVSDPEQLAGLICESLQAANSSYPSASTARFVDPAFEQRIKESIMGQRDDGRFAWGISPEGFDFYLADPFNGSEYLLHTTEHAFVPFSACEQLLTKDLKVSYDYLYPVSYGQLAKLYNLSGKLEGEAEKGYYSAFPAQIGGKPYLYLSGENETLTYLAEGDKPELVGKVVGEIEEYESSNYESIYDPQSLTIRAEAILVRELLDLYAPAKIGADGQPVCTELFRSQYNVEPMSVYEPFEAEVFSDEKDTQPEKKLLPANTWLNFVRTDGKTFIDLKMESGSEICRFYVTGDYKTGFSVNGHPADEVLNLQGWLEE